MPNPEVAGQDRAEVLALRALGWIAGDGDLLQAFLATTGAAPGDLPALAREPDFLLSVLDFLLADDGRVIAFCDAAGYGRGEPMAARGALPGGAVAHWT